MTTTTPQVALHNEIERLADALQSRADDLHAYAAAVADDESMAYALADKFAGPSRAVQLLQEVNSRLTLRPNDTDNFQRVLMAVLATAQRKA